LLGLVVVLLGGISVIVGLNALGTRPNPRSRPGGEGEPSPSLRGRRIAGMFWLVWGCGFMAAAFLHLVP